MRVGLSHVADANLAGDDLAGTVVGEGQHARVRVTGGALGRKPGLVHLTVTVAEPPTAMLPVALVRVSQSKLPDGVTVKSSGVEPVLLMTKETGLPHGWVLLQDTPDLIAGIDRPGAGRNRQLDLADYSFGVGLQLSVNFT